MNVHVEVFTDELAFYQLGTEVIHQFRVDEGLVDASAKPLPNNAFQRAVWTLLENPESSLAARIIETDGQTEWNARAVTLSCFGHYNRSSVVTDRETDRQTKL